LNNAFCQRDLVRELLQTLVKGLKAKVLGEFVASSSLSRMVILRCSDNAMTDHWARSSRSSFAIYNSVSENAWPTLQMNLRWSRGLIFARITPAQDGQPNHRRSWYGHDLLFSG
jgi:hypothetical protein